MNKKHEAEFNIMLLEASKDKKLFHKVVKSLLTQSELKEIVTRWQIVKKLSNGIPQRQIAKDLKIGIATVTRGSREYSNKKGGFVSILSKLSSKK